MANDRSLRVAPPLERPTTLDVAALLRARTKDLDGVEVGDFNDNTRPTGDEVERLIDMSYALVVGRAGANLYDPCAGLARSLVAIGAAMWVELSYFPEQVQSGRSAYAELAQQWAALLPALDNCVAGNLPADGGATNAAYRFGVLDVHGWTASPYYGAPDDA